MSPLTKKGSKIMSAMKSEYGSKKGKQVFYASKNAGKIHGVDHGFYGTHNYKATGHGLKNDPNKTDTRNLKGESRGNFQIGRETL